MRIFISGIAGFLGSHLADRLLEQGHEVVGVDNLIGGYLDNVPQQARFHQDDCGNMDAMVRHMAGCDIVFHAACTAYEGLSVFSPNLVTYNTYQITSSLVSAAIQSEVGRFIFCSSMARYGEQEVVPFTEDMTCMPQDPYGISKFAAEQLLRNLSDVHGMQYAICVPHNIIGPRQKYDDPYRNVAAIMANLMLQGRQPIVYGDGQQKRCFSFVDDDIKCIEQLMFLDDVVGEVFNIGPDEEFITILELAEVIADILDFSLDPMFLPGRPQEVKLAGCSADKARKRLGYKTEITLRNGLEQMIGYIAQRGTKPFRYHLDLEIQSELCPKSWKDRLF